MRVSAPNLVMMVSQAHDSLTTDPTPTFRVQPRVVPHFLARVDMNPSLLLIGIDLRPHVIFSVPHPSDTPSDRPTQHAETIGPFPASSLSGLKQGPYVSVSRKPFVIPTIPRRTSVEFYPCRSSGCFIWCPRRHPHGDRWRRTDRAWGIVDECEECTLEPPMKKKSQKTWIDRRHSLL